MVSHAREKESARWGTKMEPAGLQTTEELKSQYKISQRAKLGQLVWKTEEEPTVSEDCIFLNHDWRAARKHGRASEYKSLEKPVN